MKKVYIKPKSRLSKVGLNAFMIVLSGEVEFPVDAKRRKGNLEQVDVEDEEEETSFWH